MNVNLDRRIRIESVAVSTDPDYQTQGNTRHLVAQVYAEMQAVPPSRSEAVRQGLQIARNQIRCRIRWRDGITSAMRVVWNGANYNIVGGPAELGRREYMELVLERYSSEGA